MNFALFSSFGYKPLESIGMIFELVVITRLPDATWTILNKKLTFFQSYQKPLKWPTAFSFEFLVSHKLYSTYGYAHATYLCINENIISDTSQHELVLSWGKITQHRIAMGGNITPHEKICSTDIDLFLSKYIF